MDQQDELLSELQKQTKVLEGIREDAKAFREVAMKDQKKAMAQQKRATQAIMIFCTLMGLAGGAILAAIITGKIK